MPSRKIRRSPPPLCRAALVVACALPCAAQNVLSTVNFQGRLTDNTLAQNPIDAIVPMKLEIWDSQAGGSALWSELRTGANAVIVTRGIFTAPGPLTDGEVKRFVPARAKGRATVPAGENVAPR